MSAVIPVSVMRAIRLARQRLILNLLIRQLAVAWCLVLVLGIGGFLAEPWLRPSESPSFRWWALAGAGLLATVGAILSTVRWAPTLTRSALELDARFDLRERLTTIVMLRPDDLATAAGQALLADAEQRITPLALTSRFPLQPGWPAKLLPFLAITLGMIAWLYDPAMLSPDPILGGDSGPVAVAAAGSTTPAPPVARQTQPQAPSTRAAKSEELKALEEELDRLTARPAGDRQPESPEAAREKLKELTSLEERVKQFHQQQFAKLAQMEWQFRELDTLQQKQAIPGGPAQPLTEALSQGDLQKARETVDDLRKKAQAGGLSDKEQQQLNQQLNELHNELQRLARSNERDQKLQELIEEAKRQGRDVTALEREREQLRQESEPARNAIRKLADQLKKAQEAASQENLAELAKELEKTEQQLADLQEEIQDLDQTEEILQRLKQERQVACEACEKKAGQGEQGDSAKSSANPGNNDAANESGGNSLAKTGKGNGAGLTNRPNAGGIGAGQRPDNPNAQGQEAEQRIRGLFDPRGRKTFSGSIRGAAFSKQTTTEIGPAIQQAIQEAPQAAEMQRLPRDAKDAIREYFQNLGQQSPAP